MSICKTSQISTNVDNYRQIAIPSLSAKLIESSISAHILYIIRGKIKLWQHGFIKGGSTATNLLPFLRYTVPVLADGHQVNAIYTAFSRAFNTVNFDILFQLLSKLELPLVLVNVIKSYLIDRQSIVSAGEVLVDSFSPTTAVPDQLMSNLAPLLFVIFDNQPDVGLQYPMYADDDEVFLKISSDDDFPFSQNCINIFLHS